MFDSGFGGLTVARALIDLAPNEDLVYFGDTGRYPYGPRPHDEVRCYAHQITEWMVEAHDPKVVVVACNTATAVALDELQARFDVPVIGVVEPGLGAVLSVTDTDRVGVIGTVGTIASGAYQRAAAEVAPHVELTCAACPGFVEFVEQARPTPSRCECSPSASWRPSPAKVDALLLGCTHYPFLARTIADVMGRDVVLVSSADETAFAVRSALATSELEADGGRTGRHTFVSSGDIETFARLGRRLLGPELDTVIAHRWEVA